MNVTLREVGNSYVTTIPKDIVTLLNISKGDRLEIKVKNENIIMTPLKKRLRGELFLESIYNRPINEIKEWEYECTDTGSPVGDEEW